MALSAPASFTAWPGCEHGGQDRAGDPNDLHGGQAVFQNLAGVHAVVNRWLGVEFYRSPSP